MSPYLRALEYSLCYQDLKYCFVFSFYPQLSDQVNIYMQTLRQLFVFSFSIQIFFLFLTHYINQLLLSYTRILRPYRTDGYEYRRCVSSPTMVCLYLNNLVPSFISQSIVSISPLYERLFIFTSLNILKEYFAL